MGNAWQLRHRWLDKVKGWAGEVASSHLVYLEQGMSLVVYLSRRVETGFQNSSSRYTKISGNAAFIDLPSSNQLTIALFCPTPSVLFILWVSKRRSSAALKYQV